jgi:hypothetical protein
MFAADEVADRAIQVADPSQSTDVVDEPIRQARRLAGGDDDLGIAAGVEELLFAPVGPARPVADVVDVGDSAEIRSVVEVWLAGEQQ